MKCSKFIAQFLKSNGISHVFDMAGGMIACIEDAISHEDGIECIPVRHEQAAGFAAEGYSRISSNFGVAIATSGPGATNLITAIGSCYFDSTPALFITGQVNTTDIKSNENMRQNGFQELDIVALSKTITKYSNIVLDPEKILYELEKALWLMKHNRFGPVLLDIPFNVQNADINVNSLDKFIGSIEHEKILSDEKKDIFVKGDIVKNVSELIKKSKSPIILAGNGIKLSKTKKDLEKFSNANHIPVVYSLLGLDSTSLDHDYSLGFIGTYGNRSSNIILSNSDLVIVLGSRLDLRQVANLENFSKDTTIIHIDIEQHTVSLDQEKHLSLKIDLKEFFNLTKDLKSSKKENWLKFISEVRKNFNRKEVLKTDFCDPNIFFKQLSEIAFKNSTITADVGQNQMWLAQSWKVKDGQNILFSGGMGAMGFSLPVAIGAYFANPDVSVLSFSGDGGFQINIQELETIKKNNIPIKIFVLNNHSLGMVREFQDMYFDGNHQSTVIGYSCPDFKKIADAYGFNYTRLNSNTDKDSLKNIINESGAVLVEVVLNPKSTLSPKVVYGKSLENQYPHLSNEQINFLNNLKNKFRLSSVGIDKIRKKIYEKKD